MQVPLAKMRIIDDVIILEILGILSQHTLDSKELGDKIKEGFPIVEEFVEVCRFIYEKEFVNDKMLAEINHDATWVTYTEGHQIKVQQPDGDIRYFDVCKLFSKYTVIHILNGTFDRFVDVINFLTDIRRNVELHLDEIYVENSAFMSDLSLYRTLTYLSFNPVVDRDNAKIEFRFMDWGFDFPVDANNIAETWEKIELLRSYMDKLALLGNVAPEHSIVKEVVSRIPLVALHDVRIRIHTTEGIIMEDWGTVALLGYQRLIRSPTTYIKKRLRYITANQDKDEQLIIFLSILIYHWIATETLEIIDVTTATAH